MHRVIWGPVARAELAAIWNAARASDEQLLIWAVAELVFELERQSETVGESRYANMRVTFSRPLAIWFEVVDTETVWIDHIWRYRTS